MPGNDKEKSPHLGAKHGGDPSCGWVGAGVVGPQPHLGSRRGARWDLGDQPATTLHVVGLPL